MYWHHIAGTGHEPNGMNGSQSRFNATMIETWILSEICFGLEIGLEIETCCDLSGVNPYKRMTTYVKYIPCERGQLLYPENASLRGKKNSILPLECIQRSRCRTILHSIPSHRQWILQWWASWKKITRHPNKANVAIERHTAIWRCQEAKTA